MTFWHLNMSISCRWKYFDWFPHSLQTWDILSFCFAISPELGCCFFWEIRFSRLYSQSLLTFELFSVMVHSGSAAGGHYYACIRSFSDGQWYSFNDQHVSKVSLDPWVTHFIFLHNLNVAAQNICVPIQGLHLLEAAFDDRLRHSAASRPVFLSCEGSFCWILRGPTCCEICCALDIKHGQNGGVLTFKCKYWLLIMILARSNSWCYKC